MASDQTASARLHPLVLVNVSDHLMRHTFANSNVSAVGMLFGCQSGISVDVLDSAEVEFTIAEDGSPKLDKQFIREKVELTTEVFPTYELVGWYTIGTSVTEQHMAIHRQFSEFNETPLFLLMDAHVSPDAKELPIKLFESVMQVVNDMPAMTFVDVDFKIDATESERITVDLIVKGRGGNSSGSGASSLAMQLGDLHNSVQKLTQRMRLLEKYLLMTKEGTVPTNQATLRSISAICKSLPVLDSPDFHSEFAQEYDDAQLISYLASITKGAATLGEVQRKVHGFVDGSDWK